MRMCCGVFDISIKNTTGKISCIYIFLIVEHIRTHTMDADSIKCVYVSSINNTQCAGYTGHKSIIDRNTCTQLKHFKCVHIYFAVSYHLTSSAEWLDLGRIKCPNSCADICIHRINELSLYVVTVTQIDCSKSNVCL